MKSSITNYAIAILIGAAAMFFLKKCDTEIVEVPVEVIVEVPVVEKVFDTIKEPVPVPYVVKEYDKKLVENYKKANDSLKSELFKQAVKVNRYKEVFEDTIQTITVSTEVVGKLNWITAEYKTKPRKIKVDTVVIVEVPKPDKFISPYLEAGVPTNILYPDTVFKAWLDFSSGGNFIFGASYDTQSRFWGKIGYRFNF